MSSSFLFMFLTKHATVIGGGFIGIEMAENLRERGLEVTLIEMANQVMASIDYEMAAIVHNHMRENGVKLILQDGVQAFTKQGTQVVLKSGASVETDMIVLAIGVQPESTLAKDAGLELGIRGTIKVNEAMQTSDPSIYAIGDAIEVRDYVNGAETMIPLAWPANRQGRLVADHINGRDVKYKGALGTSIVKVFDITVAVTGNNEKVLKQKGLAYEAIHIPLNDLRNHIHRLSKDETIYVTCQVGLRGYLASRILKQAGFHVKNLDGGYKTYASVYHR